MTMRFAIAALTAATLSSMAFAQMGPGGPGMGQGRGPGMGAGGDCPMHQPGGPQGKGGMMGQGGMHGGMHGGMGGMHGEGGMAHQAMRAVMALDLSADQRTKITDIQRDAQRKRHAFMGKMQELRWKGQDGQKNGFNEDAARQQFDAMAALRKEMFEAGLATRKQVEAVLTPEQREKLRKSRPGPGPKA